MNRIPFFGVDRQYNNIREEILDVTDKIYQSGQVLGGEYTRLFEQTIAKMTERKYAVAVNSGTQALVFALRSISNTNKDKVLIPAVSFVATLNAVLEAGFDPVFCDVNPSTGLIDLNTIPVEINEIAAVLYVNLYGNIIDYDKLVAYQNLWTEYKIPIIEDAAQSFGAYYQGFPSGSLGDISCLSFDPTKNLNNYGSGGMVLTDDYTIYDIVRNYQNNGKSSQHALIGTNSQMSETDCAQLLIKLKYFNAWQDRRRKIAEFYTEHLDGAHGVTVIPVDSHVTHSWHKYAIHVPNRTTLEECLLSNGVETKVHYHVPLHLTPIGMMPAMLNNTGVLEGAEEFCKTTLSLPIYPELTDLEVEQVVDSILDCTSYQIWR